MTVLESIVFAARMRVRPYSISDDAKIKFAGQILDLLELNEYSDILVGDEANGEGLPKHARKRLTVGVELAGNPSILFADEPTSGLDSLSAAVVISSLERVAKQQGLTVVCTIHQPSRDVFDAFDNLLLLRTGGVCVYNGAISSLPSYLGERFAIPPEKNPADHILDVFCGTLGEAEDWGRLYHGSSMAEKALNDFEACNCASCTSKAFNIDSKPLSLSTELFMVTNRQLLTHWRTPSYMAVRFLWSIVANLIVGLVYYQIASSRDASEVLNISGLFLLFQHSCVSDNVYLTCVPVFFSSRFDLFLCQHRNSSLDVSHGELRISGLTIPILY